MTSFFRSNNKSRNDCYYAILQVSRAASLQDIKVSFRQLALQLHPDQHAGCAHKQAAFQKVNQAYQVLSNPTKRAAYDRQQGYYFSYSSSSSSSYRGKNDAKKQHTHYYSYQAGATPHYRKVYAPHPPPPEWNGFTWNHAHHYDMHYGSGMQQQAVRQAFRAAAKQEGGQLDYESPLGKGFAFVSPEEEQQQQDEEEETGNADSNTTRTGTKHHRHRHHRHRHHATNINPYSKYAPQGPPKMTLDYEEGSMEYNNCNNNNAAGRMHVHKRERIVRDMFHRRSQRRAAAAAAAAASAAAAAGSKNTTKDANGQSNSTNNTKNTQQQQSQSQQQQQYQRFQQRYYYHAKNDTFVGGYQRSTREDASNDCVIL